MPAPKPSTAFNPAPTVVMVPQRDGRRLARHPNGDVVTAPLEVWYFGDLAVDDCVRVLAIEDLIVEAGALVEQLTLAREQVALLCPEAHPELVAGLSPAALREVRRVGFARDDDEEPAAAAPPAGPRPAGSPASSGTSPAPAASSAPAPGAASAA